ncbi:MAG: QacE family quaternary ammonium compound efflux SMR transporter [Sphingobium sp.]|nr:MAG: QacE family quaternary ammonium compound efflux SMR transporter [Sphingobium sp.]
MAWIALFFAGLLEIVWAFAMKQSHGFTRLVPSLITLGAMIASFGLLSMAMRSLPLGTAYMIWTGIGAPARLAAAALILSGLVMMKLASPG